VRSVEVTVDVEPELLGLARQLGVDVADAARRGVEQTVRKAMAAADRKAYLLFPEDEDPDWDAAEAWDDGRPDLA
jgi:hypothetical protein